MDFGISPADEAFRKEVVAFLEREVTPGAVDELETGHGPGPVATALQRKFGAKGWLTINWPKKYGGLEGTHTQQLIALDEMGYYRVAHSRVGAGMAGPTILMFGNDEVKDQFLPPIARGEIEFALGYTEPNAGSDLAALEISAVEDGDYYVMNGQKIFSTAAHYAQYHWLGARTDPTAPKHRGVSLFIVDLKSPGIDVKPLIAVDGMRTNVVYYDNVRVPRRNLVGQKNRGFYHIATALDFERIFPTGEFRRVFDELVEYVRTASRGGVPLAKDPLVRQRLAEIAVEIEGARLLSYRVAWMIDNHTVPNYESSMLKMYGTETQQRMAIRALEIMGALGDVEGDSKWTQLRGRFARMHRTGFITTIYAGTNEIQRNIIATRGLGMPRG
jgi:3-oxocholest-4-en-26-oyl-CoA dehydrogenase alpha subunit